MKRINKQNLVDIKTFNIDKEYIHVKLLKKYLRKELRVEYVYKDLVTLLAHYLEVLVFLKVQDALKIMKKLRKKRLTRDILIRILYND